MKTVGEVIEALQKFPAEAKVGLYLQESEDGVAGVSGIEVQKKGDEDSQLYHKGDNPLSYDENLDEMVTICG